MGRSLAHLQSMPLTALVDLPGAHSRPGPWRGEAGFDAGLGQRCLEVSISPVVAPSIRHQRHIVVLRDISERRRAQQALSQMALTDALTGLANRAAINQHLQERVQRRGEAPFGVMFMDLDGFKAVNDSYGHRAGDEVLVAVAGRGGGDEFVLVLPDGSDDYLVRESAQLIIAAVSRPFTLGSDTAVVTPSIGAVFHPADGRDAPLLLQRADAAMYAAKARGRNGLVMYEPALDEGAQRCSRLQSLLRIDAERNAFTFVAQPKVNAAGQLTGAELLMRWTTEAYGPVSPAEFIPMAEKIGVIDLMGRHALHAAARMAAALRALGSQGTVAVNLSPQQLLRPDLERIAMRACEQHRADPAQLELELTESALLADPRQVRRTLGRLRAQGFQLALDDFGTGYSSLSYLRNLPFHKVKIDRSFVMDIEHDARARLMLKGVVQLCDSLGLGTVAEGVETDTQFELLRGVGIAEFQGFLFARPQPREQWFEALCGPPRPALDGGIWPTI
ncbi:MAG: GGDEF domain-containing protein [Burkholderiales bacterium PBB5]|nr:MAG: GGDEF domain-containing protein [Burkholderiales bacterium PBB5]